MTPTRREPTGSSAAVSAPWRILLDDVYGPERAAPVASDVAGLLADHHAGPRDERAPRWNEHDVWLITYPDQFQAAGTPPLQSLRRFLDDHLRGLCNGVHILPFFPSSSDEGFSIEDHLAVDHNWGDWSDIEAISSEWRLMVDAVVNHASARGGWFASWRKGKAAYRDFFRTADPAVDLSAVVRAREHPLLTKFDTAQGEQWVWTTFSADQVDLDYRNPAVLLRVLDAVLAYAAHGADVIRLDAVGFLWKEEATPSIHLPQTHRIVQFLRACLDEAYPDVLLITETNVPHEENISYFGNDDHPEAHAVYQFPLPPLTLHALARGDATVLGGWLRRLAAPPTGTTFLNFLASHDGVGLRPLEGLVDRPEVAALIAHTEANGGMVNRRTTPTGESIPYELNSTWYDLARGDRHGDDAMLRHLASHAIMLALRGVPAIYVQGLLAGANDTDSVAATGQARSINRRRFTDLADLGRQLGDPTTRAAQSLAGIADLVRWRGSSSAFHPDADQSILATPPAVLGIERRSGDRATARVYVNLSEAPVTLADSAAASAHGHNIEVISGGIRLGPWGNAWILG